ncbi:MAG: H-type lectin domain-containing protein [Paracoccaceae bacterium]
MKRLRNHLIGVDQGSVILFSDFDSDGEMWAGSGPRSRRIAVRFSTSFKSAPIVQVSIEMFDMDQRTNQRSDISHENVTPTGFDILFRTWGDTRVARARAGWLAIGELRDENEWDVD